MPQVNRRRFLNTTGAVAGALALTGRLKPARAGANETIRMGVIGLRGRGQNHIQGFEALDGVEVVALCDVDESILAARAGQLERTSGRKVTRYSDLRRLLDNKSVDAVSIATPNHWHSLAGIWAMQAGKDAYVEKPLSHNVWEGRQLVQAARKHKRMCQHGTQGRSAPVIREAMQKLRDGVIGDVYMARALCYKWRDSIGRTPDESVPSGVDYDLWLGPAPKRAFSKNRFHYNWHWHWAYGNGDIGNQGVHEMDMARWGLGVDMPTSVQSMGGKFLFDDDKEVPNTQIATFRYADPGKLLVFEVRPWITNHEGRFGQGTSNNVGVLFYGSKGYMAVKYFGYETFLGRKREPGPSGRGGRNEWATFIDGVRSRRIDDLGVDVEEGHFSSAHCHLANLAYRFGETIQFDPTAESCSDRKVDRLLTRDYRSPYVVPEIA